MAHTVPRGLGGRDICTNVCDHCNAFFGNHYEGNPSVETVLKETFNISRTRFLAAQDEVGKNKTMSRFTSTYFEVDLKKHKITLKAAYRLRQGFQEALGRQMKKGLYKIFLEETERQKGNGHDAQYDFIREFARYNLGDYPIFYFERSIGMIAMAKEWATRPAVFLDPDMQMKYLVNEPGFFEFEFLGHVFGIATSRQWEMVSDLYLKKTTEAKRGFFRGWRLVNHFNDVDLALSILE